MTFDTAMHVDRMKVRVTIALEHMGAAHPSLVTLSLRPALWAILYKGTRLEQLAEGCYAAMPMDVP